MNKYQLYIKKSGTKRWLKTGEPCSYRKVNKVYKRIKKDNIRDVKMKIVR